MPRTKSPDPSIVKNQIIRLRVNEAESEDFKNRAAKAGFKNISEYIRAMCLPQNDDNKNDSKKN